MVEGFTEWVFAAESGAFKPVRVFELTLFLDFSFLVLNLKPTSIVETTELSTSPSFHFAFVS